MIRSKNISLSLGKVTILQDLTFTIEKGDNVCFAGPSGTGKSSVLKMLQGYMLPDAGLIEVNGMELNVSNIKHIRSLMSYIPQNINLPVNDGAELLKLLHAGERKDQVNHFIEELGIPADMLSHQFEEMSGGEKQRIVIAICLSLERDIILLDEPTSSLDHGSIIKLINLIQTFDNKTIVAASHNSDWMNFAGKTIML